MNKDPAPELSVSDDWYLPKSLSTDGIVAGTIIRGFCHEQGLKYTGGCTIFKDPLYCGESMGQDSLLIVCHDGAACKPCVSLRDMPGDLELYESLSQLLELAGFYMQECTNWYTAVYRKEE